MFAHVTSTLLLQKYFKALPICSLQFCVQKLDRNFYWVTFIDFAIVVKGWLLLLGVQDHKSKRCDNLRYPEAAWRKQKYTPFNKGNFRRPGNQSFVQSA